MFCNDNYREINRLPWFRQRVQVKNAADHQYCKNNEKSNKPVIDGIGSMSNKSRQSAEDDAQHTCPLISEKKNCYSTI